jgi:hypothetical protein
MHQLDTCYDCFNRHKSTDPRLSKDCEGHEGEDGLHRYCDPEHDKKKCYNEMNQNFTCKSYLREDDDCYDCYDRISEGNTTFKEECKGPGEKGLDQFCEPHPSPENCFEDMNISCPNYMHQIDACYDCY